MNDSGKKVSNRVAPGRGRSFGRLQANLSRHDGEREVKSRKIEMLNSYWSLNNVMENDAAVNSR